MLTIITKELTLHRGGGGGGITNEYFFDKMQITNWTPSKNSHMHYLVPCIATSVFGYIFKICQGALGL